MRKSSNAGDIEQKTMWIARALGEKVDLTSVRKPFRVLGLGGSQRVGIAFDRETVDPNDGNIQVRLFSIPVVQKLVRTTIDVPRND